MSASLKARSRGQAPPTPSGDWVSRQREPGSWGPLVGGGGSFPAQHLLLAAAHLELSHRHSSARGVEHQRCRRWTRLLRGLSLTPRIQRWEQVDNRPVKCLPQVMGAVVALIQNEGQKVMGGGGGGGRGQSGRPP